MCWLVYRVLLIWELKRTCKPVTEKIYQTVDLCEFVWMVRNGRTVRSVKACCFLVEEHCSFWFTSSMQKFTLYQSIMALFIYFLPWLFKPMLYTILKYA